MFEAVRTLPKPQVATTFKMPTEKRASSFVTGGAGNSILHIPISHQNAFTFDFSIFQTEMNNHKEFALANGDELYVGNPQVPITDSFINLGDPLGEAANGNIAFAYLFSPSGRMGAFSSNFIGQPNTTTDFFSYSVRAQDSSLQISQQYTFQESPYDPEDKSVWPPDCSEFALWYSQLNLKELLTEYSVGQQPVGYMFTSQPLSQNEIERPDVSVTFLYCPLGGQIRKVNQKDLVVSPNPAQYGLDIQLHFQGYTYFTIAQYNARANGSEGLWPIDSRKFQALGAKTNSAFLSADNIIVLLMPQ